MRTSTMMIAAANVKYDAASVLCRFVSGSGWWCVRMPAPPPPADDAYRPELIAFMKAGAAWKNVVFCRTVYERPASGTAADVGMLTGSCCGTYEPARVKTIAPYMLSR